MKKVDSNWSQPFFLCVIEIIGVIEDICMIVWKILIFLVNNYIIV